MDQLEVYCYMVRLDQAAIRMLVWGDGIHSCNLWPTILLEGCFFLPREGCKALQVSHFLGVGLQIVTPLAHQPHRGALLVLVTPCWFYGILLD